jgi:hypothetical protein
MAGDCLRAVLLNLTITARRRFCYAILRLEQDFSAS